MIGADGCTVPYQVIMVIMVCYQNSHIAVYTSATLCAKKFTYLFYDYDAEIIGREE